MTPSRAGSGEPCATREAAPTSASGTEERRSGSSVSSTFGSRPAPSDAEARLRGTPLGEAITERLEDLSNECVELEDLLQIARAKKKRLEALQRIVATYPDEQLAALDPTNPNSWITTDQESLR